MSFLSHPLLPILLPSEIDRSALRAPNGSLMYTPENAPWNRGAIMLADLSITGNYSRATDQLQVASQQQMAARTYNYTYNGQYLDSIGGGQQTLSCGFQRHQQTSTSTLASPPTFDAHGEPVWLQAQQTLPFLAAVAASVRGAGGRVFGNTLFHGPYQGFVPHFDVTGTETNWQAPGGEFLPEASWSLAYKRFHAGARPYLFLQNTDFSTWTVENTQLYMDACLAHGIWPGFFSADAATSPYFANATLYNRDRSLFCAYMPWLKVLNEGGWQARRSASLSNVCAASAEETLPWDGAGQPSRAGILLEQFGVGSGSGALSSRLLFTLRNLACPEAVNTTCLTVDMGSGASGSSAVLSATVWSYATGPESGAVPVSQTGQAELCFNGTRWPALKGNATLVVDLQWN